MNKVQCASYLNLTGGDQIVDVIESFLHCFAYRHQAVVSQDEHLGPKKRIITYSAVGLIKTSMFAFLLVF